MIYAPPGSPGSLVNFQNMYPNFINGSWVHPVLEQYFEVLSPANGKPYTKVARSTSEDVALATDAAKCAFKTWGKTSPTERSLTLLNIANTIEKNLEMLAVAESWGNGKPVRETLHADLPLVIDHFRYFASVIRADEGTSSQLDHQTTSLHLKEPLGVVGQIIPWNFPLLMASWKIAPALAAGNTIVLKPAEQTPTSILILIDLIKDFLPKGVLNVVNGYGPEAGAALVRSNQIAKIAFTGESSTGKIILESSAKNLIPVTLELGGKSPNIFFGDILDYQDEFVEKCLEGFSMFAFNQGEVCTCPSRALIQSSIYNKFLEMAVERVSKIKVGNPLDTETMMGAQASGEQLQKINDYVKIGQKEGANLIVGGKRKIVDGLENGYYFEPTIFSGRNSMRIFQEEIFGPIVAVTEFNNLKEAIDIANDTEYGLGAGLWTRNIHVANEAAQNIQAGRIWTNCYHNYPAHAAFGGYKKSGFGRENHKMMLSHYTQTKNILISHSKSPLGLF